MTEPRVSDEDRSEAILKVAEAIQGAAHGRAAARKAKLAVEALVADGWGPRPRVRLADIPVERAAGAYEVSPNPTAAMRDVLAEWLRECGIEVTR